MKRLTRKRKGSCFSTRQLFLLLNAIATIYHLKKVADLLSATNDVGTVTEAPFAGGAEAIAGVPRAVTVRTVARAHQRRQLANYRRGAALLLNVHAVHHGGTSVCDVLGRSGGSLAFPRHEIAPSFACWLDKDGVSESRFSPHESREFRQMAPVRREETGEYVKATRARFHMASWEFNGVDDRNEMMRRNLSDTDWEHPHLVSVVVTREPISRMLAGDMDIHILYPGYDTLNLSRAGWWDYATNPARQQTDNFFLRILAGKPRRANVTNRRKRARVKRYKYMYTNDNLPRVEDLHAKFDIGKSQYDRAVEVLNRFTVVLDLACLDQGLRTLARLLNLNTTFVDDRVDWLTERRKRLKTGKKRHLQTVSLRDRIGYDDVYEYLLERNKWDIRLYEYSKTISLVNCGG